ncbi:MAG: tetratricopeptide repeat protein [Gemmatimonadota bacterium]|nr:MAG: tetratricopeptide repeat protein [Gemmatimonadota bacterium]
MTLSRMALVTGSVAVLALYILPADALAQRQRCTGERPRGGRWVSSGELYLDRARRNPRLDEKRNLYQQALDVLVEGFVEQPDNPRNYVLAGRAYEGLGDYVGADSVWRKAEEMWSCYHALVDTLRHTAWTRVFNSAIGYFRQGEIERALTLYQAAWTVYDRMPQPMLQIGGIYARQAAEPGVDLDTRSELQGKAIESFQTALAALDRSERLSPEDRQQAARSGAFNLAQVLALQGRYEEAAAAYERFLAEEPDNVAAITNVAVVLTRAARQLASQADMLEEGTEKEALLTKSDSLESVASQYYDQLLAREDLAADDYHNVGIGLSQIGLHTQAAEAFNKALELQPYRANSLENLGLALFYGQQYDTLVRVAQKLVERYPLSENNLNLLASAYRDLNDTQNALEILERRSELTVDLPDQQLELEAADGTFAMNGSLRNINVEPGSSVELLFDFYDDAGELVASAPVSVVAPEQGASTSFSVSVESAVAISGFTYKPAGT